MTDINHRPLVYPTPRPSDLPGLVSTADGWMSDAEIACMLGFALLTKGHVPGGILEVGAYKGRTTSGLVHAAAPDDPIVVVDTFRGASDNLPDEDFYAAFEANMEPSILLKLVEVHRGDSREVLPALAREGRKFRMILIDGDHETSAALADFVNAWPLLSEGGYLFVDDVDWPSVQQAMLRFMRHLDPHQTDLNMWATTQKVAYVRKVNGRML